MHVPFVYDSASSSTRLCWRSRYGCEGIVSPLFSGAACERCLAQGHPLHAPRSAPKVKTPIPDGSWITDGPESSLTGALSSVKAVRPDFADPE